MNRLSSRSAALVAAGLISIAACSDDSSVDSTTSAGPSRIVSPSPPHTEMLFALGAGDSVVAVEEFSNYPPEAEAVMSSLSGFEPNVEAIAAYDPDLVVIGGDYTGLTEQLAAIDIPVWSGEAPTVLEDAYGQIAELGARIGRAEAGEELAASMRAEIDALVADTEISAEPLTYYHELDETYYSVSAASFIGQVYGLFGLVNITETSGIDSDYPQLSAEFIVESGPDLIFLACTLYCGTTPDSIAERPGWDQIPAVVDGAIIELNDDVVSRWGPRLVDFVELVASAVAEASATR